MSRSHKRRYFCGTRTYSYDVFFKNYLNRRFRRQFDPTEEDQLTKVSNMRKTAPGGTWGWDQKWGVHSLAELKRLAEDLEDPGLLIHHYWK